MDFIRSIVLTGKSVTTVALGFCASAAVDIFLAGSRRLMGRNSYILIHQLSLDIGGTYTTLRVEMKNSKKFMKHARHTCHEYTRLPEHVIDKLLTQDVNLTAKRCLKYGIVDELI